MVVVQVNFTRNWAWSFELYFRSQILCFPINISNQDEGAVEFANRVKRKIAMAGGLVDLVWDGNLKRQVH